MPQTEIEETMPLGVAGQLADLYTSEHGDVVSATNEEASAELAFGLFVKKGTADNTVKKLNAADNALEGVVVHSHGYHKPVEIGDTGLKPGVTMGILRKGRIIVLPETAVTPASEVHVRAVAAGEEIAGAVRATADGADTIDITGFASFRGSADAGEPVVLEIDMPNSALAAVDS